MKPEECIKCEMSIKDPLFWDLHQTMTDGRIWCAYAKRT
jgi:hypothetical protein